jgi:type I restriction enzyme S subunit
MQELLTGRRRLPGFAGSGRYRQTEVGVVPKAWEVIHLGAIAKVFDGTHQTPEYVIDGVPFYSVEHVTKKDFKNTKFISQEAHQELTRSHKIEKGDILMTRIGSIGDCVLVDWEVEASFYVSLALIKINYTSVSPKFIVHYSSTTMFDSEVNLHSLPTATPKKINLGPISKLRIPLPPLPEQKAIAEVLSDMDAEIETLEQKRDKYKKIKQGMMEQLLTGKVRLI